MFSWCSGGRYASLVTPKCVPVSLMRASFPEIRPLSLTTSAFFLFVGDLEKHRNKNVSLMLSFFFSRWATQKTPLSFTPSLPRSLPAFLCSVLSSPNSTPPRRG